MVPGQEEGMEAARPISFSVRYRLFEYLRFVTAHAFHTDASLRDLRGARRIAAHLTLLLVGTVGFAWKTARVGRCDFVLDVQGVRRRTRRGSGSVSWSGVKAIHAYAPGLLVELGEGALPLPLRVLTDAQRAEILHVASAAGVPCPSANPLTLRTHPDEREAVTANVRDWR
ncbi:hypothetical protein [Novilysobacter defluvii]|uniref:Uncharacterized protein n=1 Tax=Lysobacter defluvii IMMIB APB-9 = DSM 18482 TaxID=1385515 RepID=A0A0A0M9K3_9GAMM|nr:hypothetical protein [Lysobacter defluvii]KGO98677.1 hypothetical protein N791_14805 [Lysobacter defluvii IMMIB APB-9 = DSM 18482]